MFVHNVFINNIMIAYQSVCYLVFTDLIKYDNFSLIKYNILILAMIY